MGRGAREAPPPQPPAQGEKREHEEHRETPVAKRHLAHEPALPGEVQREENRLQHVARPIVRIDERDRLRPRRVENVVEVGEERTRQFAAERRAPEAVGREEPREPEATAEKHAPKAFAPRSESGERERESQAEYAIGELEAHREA